MSKIRRHNAPFSEPAIYTIWSHKLTCQKGQKECIVNWQKLMSD